MKALTKTFSLVFLLTVLAQNIVFAAIEPLNDASKTEVNVNPKFISHRIFEYAREEQTFRTYKMPVEYAKARVFYKVGIKQVRRKSNLKIC